MDGTTNTHDEQGQGTNPFENPLVRHGVGFSGAIIIAAVAFLYLEGMVRNLALGVAVLDAVVTPKILEMAVESESEGERDSVFGFF